MPTPAFDGLHEITLVTELRRLNMDDRPFRRAVLAGDAVRIHPGAYLSAEVWRSLSRDDRYRHQVLAAAMAARGEAVISHVSAAVLWGIPIIERWPQVVHVLASTSIGTRTEGGFRKHGVRNATVHVTNFAGATVTDFDRTLIDIVVAESFASGVAAVDWGLRPSSANEPKQTTTIERLAMCAEDLKVVKGSRKVRRVLEFASPRSGSAGESLSRVTMHELGFAAPVLQQEFRDRDGLIGFTDFWWPENNLAGEFDGVAKYVREQYTASRSVEQVVIDEKVREDRIRAVGPRFTRWGWATANNRALMFNQLVAAGLPRPRGKRGVGG